MSALVTADFLAGLAINAHKVIKNGRGGFNGGLGAGHLFDIGSFELRNSRGSISDNVIVQSDQLSLGAQQSGRLLGKLSVRHHVVFDWSTDLNLDG